MTRQIFENAGKSTHQRRDSTTDASKLTRDGHSGMFAPKAAVLSAGVRLVVVRGKLAPESVKSDVKMKVEKRK